MEAIGGVVADLLRRAGHLLCRHADGRRAVKRPPKTPDRAYPLVKNQEYAYAYDWEYRPG
jgi:hypothetical protein